MLSSGRIFFTVLALTGFFACKTKEAGRSIEVSGTVKNATTKMIYLEEDVPNGQPTIMDSSELKPDGSFKLQAPSKEEALYQLRLTGKTTPLAFVVSDVNKVAVQADAAGSTQAYTVSGSPASQALVDLEKTLREQSEKIVQQGKTVDSLRTANAPDNLVNTEYFKIESLAEESKVYLRDFNRKHNSPVLSVYAISSFQNHMNRIDLPGFSKPEIVEAVSAAASRFPAHSGLQAINKSLAPAKAADFTQPGMDGQPVSLSSFKGKYVLLDFWASWCRPCRMENPNVVKAFNQFKDKNFTVFGVSLDQSKDAWQQAIQKDGLTWTHASDLKYWQNEAAVLYGVQGIPANFLIDPQGNVIAQNLRGEELIETLKRVLK